MLEPEFSPTPHEKGILSMARGAEPASATTSFFLVLGPAPSLDNQYTVFGRVVEGLEVLDAIAAVPVEGETPVTRVEVTGVRVVRP
jgi:peptidyl-prolyl cis-trans isomerase B (cyclophilin B)